MAPLPLWLLWLLLPLGPRAQKLPTRNEELFQMQVRDKAFFHDSSVLPDGAEISSYLFRDTPKRYFFVVEEDNTPLSVTVTPCDTPLEWRLSLQELPEEASGQGSGEQEPEPLEQQRPQATHETGAELLSYQGNDVESFVSAGAPSGLYRLELLSTEKDAHFRVYATTTPASDHSRPQADIQKVCIGNKNIFTVSDLKPDTQYYFDVFVANGRSNMSTAYVGTFARTREEAAQKTLELKDRKVTEVFVKRKGAKLLRFAPVSSHQKVAFFVHSCLDAVRVQVRLDGKLVLSQSVEGVRQFLLRGRPKAKYLLRLKGSRKGASLLKVLASTRPGKHAFPSLPEDTRIKAFDRLRTCSSATVAWLGTQERSKFCLYKKEVGDAYSEDQRKREQNQCLGPDTRAKSEKVLCKYFHSRNPQRAVTTETVRGLQPGKAYLLDVYLVGHGGHSVKYQSKVVKTRRVC
ncbi:PREDICTED: protein NDNF [Myotis brandtii]|uniref:protein NDNF n=1 Tax=Myotis brandtii TaxID=109478 RepID=UPI0007041B3E|nr:PREDICTED: protein NDNF [Myotis brandtii]